MTEEDRSRGSSADHPKLVSPSPWLDEVDPDAGEIHKAKGLSSHLFCDERRAALCRVPCSRSLRLVALRADR